MGVGWEIDSKEPSSPVAVDKIVIKRSPVLIVLKLIVLTVIGIFLYLTAQITIILFEPVFTEETSALLSLISLVLISGLGVLLGMRLLWRWVANYYEINTAEDELIDRTGIMGRERKVLSLGSVQSVTYSRAFWASFLIMERYGFMTPQRSKTRFI